MKSEVKGVELESPPTLAVPQKPEAQSRKTPADGGKKKRRTKTGCLTCRQRRIKCGEEGRICTHCIKSKRECHWSPGEISAVFDYPLSLPLQHDPYHNDVQKNGSGFAREFPPSYPLPPSQPRRNSNKPSEYGTYPEYSLRILPSQRNLVHQNENFVNDIGPFPCVTYLVSPNQVAQLQGWQSAESVPDVSTGEGNSFHEATLQVFQQNIYGDPEIEVPNHHPHNSTNGHLISPHSFQVLPGYDYALSTPAKQSTQFFDGRRPSAYMPYSVPHFGRPGITQALEHAAVEKEDNDYYDCFSDEDEGQNNDISLTLPSGTPRNLGAMTSLYNETTDELGVRRHDAFVNPGMIDHYRPERVANPLRNEATARVFNHFITSTGPMLPIFERRLKSTGAIFEEYHTPPSERSLWSYTLPLMALHDQAVLHSMLALSSLHIAKLQGASTTPSIKHYAYALKQLRKAVASPEKRHKVTTLAASLLIGFYEVMTAAHLSWSALLVGAKQLLSEVDFIDTTRRLRAWKIRRAWERLHFYSDDQTFGSIESPSLPEDCFFEHFEDLNLGLLELFYGVKLPYADEAHEGRPVPPKNFTYSQLGETEVLQDLYWWYLKQDLIYALISGNHLLLNFDQWSHCPPRAPIGLPNAVYGSADHLVILLGRTVQFIATDRPRKIKATRFPKMPFYGMAPAMDTKSMPPSFSSARVESSTKESPSLVDIETATARALEEWNHLRGLNSLFEQRLGSGFQALSAAEFQPFDTPFGSGILYSNFDIAVIWMNYYMGLIALIRGHPSMPPAATAAIGAAARDTAPFAILIGRIGAGVMNAMTSSSTSALLGAALGGCVLPFFVAGVQLQDAHQRRWIVQHLRQIEQQSGWASVGLCAVGCETAWTQAAKMGQGPPYSCVCADEKSGDVRLNGKGREPNEPLSEVNDRGLVPFSKKARLQFASALLETEEELEKMSLVDLA